MTTKNNSQVSSSLCLTMMVKNEAHIIERCLESIANHIDYWIVCDTGSEDGTQQIVKDYFKKKNIPGELHQHQWKNYGYNRTLTLQQAKGKADYLLLADADYIFKVDTSTFSTKLRGIAYYYYNISDSLKYKMLKILKASEEWRYVGVTHEYVECVTTPEFLQLAKTIKGLHVQELHDGGNRKEKFDNDVKLLTQGVKDEPGNLRYIFYLARTYEDTNQYEKAIYYYRLRIKGGGWEEENYYSRYGIVRCLIQLKKSFGEILQAAFEAFEFRPIRIEAIHAIVEYCRIHKYYQTGYLVGKSLIDVPVPSTESLFIHLDIYVWRLKDEVAICAYYVGAYEESLRWNKELLGNPTLPLKERSRIRKNLDFAQSQLTEV